MRQAQQDAAANSDAITAIHNLESSHLLRHNTVAQARVVGFVYMDMPKGMKKESRIGRFVIDLGDTIYIFHYVNGVVPKSFSVVYH